MLATIVILVFVCLLLGMALSVSVFGTGSKRAKAFENIYFSVEDVSGMGVLYTKKGDYSVIMSMENPVRKYSADIDRYYDFTSVMSSVMETLGEGYAIHKQDIFIRKRFDTSALSMKSADTYKNFLSDAYFRHFSGRPYTESKCYLIITIKGRGGIHSFDSHEWSDFILKAHKVYDRLASENIKARFLGSEECKLYADRYYAMNFSDKHFSFNDFKVDSEEIGMGDRHMKVYSLLDVDNVGLPGTIKPFKNMVVNNSVMPEDLLSELDGINGPDTIVYNQVVFLPNQKREIFKLEKNRNRHASIPNPNNKIAVDDINAVLDDIARNGRSLVYAHYDLVVSAPKDMDFHLVTNQLENLLARNSMTISKRAYNQLELYVATFPGNCFRLNKDYDRFLTVSEPAMCLMYKEHQATSDAKELKCFYTDRQGVPLAIDLTGKEGKIRYTNNSNFFVLGPSGSGKSFFMNTVIRQYYEQNTDCVIVDTGDSYEGLCGYFGGTYITYSKEHPISMNPFKINKQEYEQNFEEKKNFLKSLVFLIFKGKEKINKIEDVIIDQTIIEYYKAYFSPFVAFTDDEREAIRRQLLLFDKRTGKYDSFVEKLEDKYGDRYDIPEFDELIKKHETEEATEDVEMARVRRQIPKLKAILADPSSTKGEKEAARAKLEQFSPGASGNQLALLTPAVIERKYLRDIDDRIVKLENERRKNKVKELSFNSYYEFVMERIPQIMREDKVDFDIDNFSKILKQFYKGGPYETTLNSDMDTSLFDERFIVFEIDKIKDDPVIFPIVTLIIMDVFTQKMRLKKGRKCLVIEEAWKAIATPVMANYIKYLYKTARKHWAMVGVVTQELQDIISSDIVKEAIINNSDVFMLLDQSKFKDKFDDIKSTLSLTDLDCKKIFTINRLDNHEGRSPFKEVFIRRGQFGEVYGVEEPPECYMNYTTEKVEKEALKLYRKQLHGTQRQAIEAFVRDWKGSGIRASIDFAKKVMEKGRMLPCDDKRTTKQ